jgi:hypothetical protein
MFAITRASQICIGIICACVVLVEPISVARGGGWPASSRQLSGETAGSFANTCR